MRAQSLLITAFLSLAIAAPALGHGGEVHHIAESPAGPQNWTQLLTTWSDEPLSWTMLIVSAVLYTIGLARLWHGHGVGRGVRAREAACFATGWFALFMALVSPLHPWGNVLFSAHMTQHEILMLVAAPLLVLGRPVVVTLKGLPRSTASSLAWLMNRHAWRGAKHTLELPLLAWLIHALALWIWHVPALFEGAVRNEFVHVLQHASFFGTALLFWWSLFNARRGAQAYGAGVLYLFTTAAHNSLLGALLTFTNKVWYEPYTHSPQAWGLTPLQDQQLGGLIMWIPAGLVYVAAGLTMIVYWLRESERLALAREAEADLFVST